MPRSSLLLVLLSTATAAGAACTGGTNPIVSGKAGSGGIAGSPGSAGTGGSGGAPVAGGSGQGTAGAPVVDTGVSADTDGAAGTGGASPAPDGSATDAASGDSGPTVNDPGTEGDGIVKIAAPFTAAPDMSVKAGVAKGKTLNFSMSGRACALYLPAGYVSGTEIPFMVAQDGLGFSGDVRTPLDNMIADGRLPAMAVIFADPGANRSVEYDTASDKYYQFVETQLLPQAVMQAMMQANVVLNLTKDPEGRGAYGGSSGGAAAFTMGWFHPESYRRILTISGSFVALQKSPPDFPQGCADYFMTEVPNTIPNTTPPKPLRVFIEAGSNDGGGTIWRDANDSMGKVMAAKGYHYRYVQAQGAVHEDAGARHQYLPDALLWLWRGYKKP
ncbi:MAG TPA: alpha/beta hydrolase-fold protein [Polyangia bacterium]